MVGLFLLLPCRSEHAAYRDITPVSTGACCHGSAPTTGVDAVAGAVQSPQASANAWWSPVARTRRRTCGKTRRIPKHLIGASADLLQQVAGQLGLKVELLYAGKRSQALDEVRSGRMDMLADAPLTVSELETLDYIHPPLLENDYLVWTRKDSSLVYNERAGPCTVIPARCRKSLD